MNIFAQEIADDQRKTMGCKVFIKALEILGITRQSLINQNLFIIFRNKWDSFNISEGEQLALIHEENIPIWRGARHFLTDNIQGFHGIAFGWQSVGQRIR